MSLLDNAVGGLVVLGAGAFVWAAKAFVRQNSRADEARVAAEAYGDSHPRQELTVRQATEIGDALLARLNGRYMLAEESRKEFRKMETQFGDLQYAVRSLAEEVRNSAHRT